MILSSRWVTFGCITKIIGKIVIIKFNGFALRGRVVVEQLLVWIIWNLAQRSIITT